MKGYTITYKAFTNNNRAQLNFVLFGRIIQRRTKVRSYGYYKKGMLDNIEFFRIKSGQIFVKSLDGINFEDLRMFGEVNVVEDELNITDADLLTAEEYWYNHAMQKGIIYRKCQK